MIYSEAKCRWVALTGSYKHRAEPEPVNAKMMPPPRTNLARELEARILRPVGRKKLDVMPSLAVDQYQSNHILERHFEGG